MAGGGFVEDGFFTCLASKQNADRRRRHGLEAHDTCWLCDQEAETVDHLRVNCSFAKVIWWNLLSWMDCSCSFQGPLQLHTWWEHLRHLQVRERRRGLHTHHVHHLGYLEGAKQPSVRGQELHRA